MYIKSLQSRIIDFLVECLKSRNHNSNYPLCSYWPLQYSSSQTASLRVYVILSSEREAGPFRGYPNISALRCNPRWFLVTNLVEERQCGTQILCKKRSLHANSEMCIKSLQRVESSSTSNVWSAATIIAISFHVFIGPYCIAQAKLHSVEFMRLGSWFPRTCFLIQTIVQYILLWCMTCLVWPLNCFWEWKNQRGSATLLFLPSVDIWRMANTNRRAVDNKIYYSTIVSFRQIRSRERAKYATVIHWSVPVWPVYNRANTDKDISLAFCGVYVIHMQALAARAISGGQIMPGVS